MIQVPTPGAVKEYHTCPAVPTDVPQKDAPEVPVSFETPEVEPKTLAPQVIGIGSEQTKPDWADEVNAEAKRTENSDRRRKTLFI